MIDALGDSSEDKPHPDVRADFPRRSIAPALDALRVRTGTRYEIVRKLPGGAWGAWLVRDAEGRRAVLKCLWDEDWRRRLKASSLLVERVRARGVPAPRYLLSGWEDGVGTWYIQDWCRGEPLAQLTMPLLDEVIALSDRLIGAAHPRIEAFDWSAYLRRQVTRADSGFLAGVREYSSTLSRMGNVLQEMGEQALEAHPPTTDIVHGDFLVTQFLRDGDAISALLDWDAAGCGDRGFDLALLFQNVHVQASRTGHPLDDRVVVRLGRIGIESCGDQAFAGFLAYHLGRMLSFVARFNPRHVPWRYGLARQILSSLDVVRTGAT